MTEYEWREQIKKARRGRPDWWGAQCFDPFIRKRRFRLRILRWGMLILSIVIAIVMPALYLPQAQEHFEEISLSSETAMQTRKIRAVSYQLPESLEYQQQIFIRAELANGNMLLLDEEHLIPSEHLPSNAVSIAQYGNGMVPVRSLNIRSGYETINALKALFEQLRARNVQGIAISEGMLSAAQQREKLIQSARQLMREQSIQNAAETVRKTKDWPGTGSLLQEYTVEVDFSDGLPLEAHQQGQTFLQLCWRYGFVRESANRPTRFRYVGKAHAAAMTYLDLELKSYLEWMHQKGVLVIASGGRPQYLILCQPMQGEYAAFDLPVDAACEVSMDNTGYALAACTL